MIISFRCKKERALQVMTATATSAAPPEVTGLPALEMYNTGYKCDPFPAHPPRHGRQNRI